MDPRRQVRQHDLHPQEKDLGPEGSPQVHPLQNGQKFGFRRVGLEHQLACRHLLPIEQLAAIHLQHGIRALAALGNRKIIADKQAHQDHLFRPHQLSHVPQHVKALQSHFG